MFTLTDILFLCLLPILLIVSGFFSGSETALFGLTAQQRLRLTREGGIAGRAAAGLLADPSALLVTLMLGNMTINVLYFVISSALLLGLDAAVHPALIALLSIAPLIAIILLGEVLPKLVANTARLRWVRVTGVPLFAIHTAVRPFGTALARWVIRPLGRLVAPQRAGAGDLTTDELAALLEMSETRGVIAADEQQLLRDVLQLSQLKVRDIMTPRVDTIAIDIHQPPHKLRELIVSSGLSKFVACDGRLDKVLGVIYARQFLLAHRLEPNLTLSRIVRQVRFVPEIQRVDELLEDFRRSGTNLAIAVDEYGGTAGLITIKDIVEQMVGDLDMDEAPGEGEGTPAESLGDGRWRVSGRLSVHDWAEAFGAVTLPPRVSTVGGLVTALIGRAPRVGDTAHLSNLQLTVEAVDGQRVQSVVLKLDAPEAPEAPDTPDGEARQ